MPKAAILVGEHGVGGLADERATVEGLGMSYIPLPIVGEGAINFDNANELDQLLELAAIGSRTIMAAQNDALARR